MPDAKDNPKLATILNRIPKQWGKWVDVGPGWHPIVIELDQQLAAIDPNYEIHQVKEKFGGLRYYCSLETDTQGAKLIKAAETKCWVTCDQCGDPGVARSGGWIVTRCEPCYRAQATAKVSVAEVVCIICGGNHGDCVQED